MTWWEWAALRQAALGGPGGGPPPEAAGSSGSWRPAAAAAAAAVRKPGTLAIESASSSEVYQVMTPNSSV